LKPTHCKCGRQPKTTKRAWPHGHIIQIVCDCGAKSIEAAYKAEADEPTSKESAIKAWNIAHGVQESELPT
jgi:hypothetical protein